MSNRSSGPHEAPPGEDVPLLPPRLQPLSHEQRREAVALLRDVLLAAARGAAAERNEQAAVDAPRTDAVA